MDTVSDIDSTSVSVTLSTLMEPITVAVPVTAPIQVTEQLLTPAAVSTTTDAIDILYNKMILNSSLLSTINTLKTNGFTNASIPLLLMSITTTYNGYTTATPRHALTVDDMQVLLERVYNYLIDKYNLVDAADRLAMYNMFDASLKLCLAIPNVKKNLNSCLKFFKCK